MNRERAQELLYRITHTLKWTLRGGNDPEDHGNTKEAVKELGEVLSEVIAELADK